MQVHRLEFHVKECRFKSITSPIKTQNTDLKNNLVSWLKDKFESTLKFKNQTRPTFQRDKVEESVKCKESSTKKISKCELCDTELSGQIVFLECLHTFCESCFLNSLEKQNLMSDDILFVCPVRRCKQNISEEVVNNFLAPKTEKKEIRKPKVSMTSCPVCKGEYAKGSFCKQCEANFGISKPEIEMVRNLFKKTLINLLNDNNLL